MSAVGERGQVTIPKAIRDQFGLTKGVEVEFEVLPDGVKVTKRSGKQSVFARYEGYLADRWVIGDIDQYLKESRGR
jgi:AbrB family looped-hinge helix DNA binding protein